MGGAKPHKEQRDMISISSGQKYGYGMKQPIRTRRRVLFTVCSFWGV